MSLSCPIQPCQSLRQTPDAPTRITTPSRLGRGSATVTTSGGFPKPLKSTAFKVRLQLKVKVPIFQLQRIKCHLQHDRQPLTLSRACSENEHNLPINPRRALPTSPTTKRANFESRANGQWPWLLERPHPWWRHLWVKGRNLLAATVWLDTLTNGRGPREATENRDLPFADDFHVLNLRR